MRSSIVFVTVAALLLGGSFADLTFRKQDSPAKIDVSSRSLFGPFPGPLCRMELLPVGVMVAATPVLCKDSSAVPTIRGPFANTTCFSLVFGTATTFQAKVTCTDNEMNNFVVQNLRVAVTDAAPTCRNYTVAVTRGGHSRFFLLASDPDDGFLQYHIRNASISSLKGKIKYCAGCSAAAGGEPENPSNWFDYQSLIDLGNYTRFSRMFEYTPPESASEDFQESIMFSAIDPTTQECPFDGKVTFKVERVAPPVISPNPTKKIFVGRPQLVSVAATSNVPVLRFVLKTVPPKTCAIVCAISEAARVTLRDFPGEDLSGQILEPCTIENALRAGSDVTLTSSKDTFFSRTFVTVKAISTCSVDQTSNDPVTFDVIASADGVESAPATQSLQVVEVVQRCVPFATTFAPGSPVRIPVSKFVVTPGAVSLTTLTNADFDLQIAGSQLTDTQASSETEVVFIGTSTIEVTVMVQSIAPRWTGYCRLSFKKSDGTVTNTPSPPAPTTPTPISSPPTTTAPFLTEPTTTHAGAFSTTLWFIVVLVVCGILYLNRHKIRLFAAAPAHPPRRYGVVASGEAED